MSNLSPQVHSASLTPPSTPKQRSSSIDSKEVMGRLLDLGYYLGSDDVVDKVAFLPAGRTEHRLVTKAGLNDDNPTEVQLSVVAEIKRDTSWLSAEGNYRPSSLYNDTIKDAKAKIELISPTIPELALFANDWEKCTTNLRTIHDNLIKTCGLRPERREPFAMNPTRIVMRHRLVIVKQCLSVIFSFCLLCVSGKDCGGLQRQRPRACCEQ